MIAYDIKCSCGVWIWSDWNYCPHCGINNKNPLSGFKIPENIKTESVKLSVEDVTRSNKHMEEVRRDFMQKSAASEISAGEIWLD